MKKRLLSAALALAMVLTMLPLTVFAAATVTTDSSLESGKTKVKWYNEGATIQSKVTIAGTEYDALVAPAGGGWYGVKTGDDRTSVYQATGGVVNDKGVWYTDIDTALAAKQNNLKLIDAQTHSSGDLTTALFTSLTIDLNGQTLSGTFAIPGKYSFTNSKGETETKANTFSKLTIKDSGSYNSSGSTFSVTVGADEAKTSATTVELLNLKTTGDITATYDKSCTVNVKGSETGNITLTGVSGGGVNLGDSNTRATVSAVSVTTTGTATGGKVTAFNTVATSVALSGVGANLTATASNMGAITLFGHKADGLTEAQKNSLAAPSVTLNNTRGGQSASSIGVAGSDAEALTKAYSVTLNSAIVSSTGITLPNANVYVNNSAAGSIDVDSGSVALSGSASGPASAGTISLGASNKTASLTVTGSNVTTDTITAVSGAKVNITVPSGEENVFGSLTGTINNRGISGGVWGSAVPAGNLVDSLVYQVQGASGSVFGSQKVSGDGKYVYYAGNQFQKLIDAYQLASSVEITLIKDGSGANKSITFMNGTDTLTVIKYKNGSLPITLPTTVNGGAVSKWTEYKVSGGAQGDLVRDLVNTAGYSTPATPEDRILNAQVTDNAITKLVGVATSVPGLTVRLVNGVITLSGAVPRNTTDIEIQVTTDGNPGIQDAEIHIVYDPSNGAVRFANQEPEGGMWVTNDWAYLVMPNDTTRYSLNGSGLKVEASSLTGKVHGYTGDVPVIAGVTCSGTGWTNYRKQELANALTNDYGNTMGTLSNASGSKVSFAASPAVQEALNAVVAGISESQVNSWLLNAQNAAWRAAGNTTTPTVDQRNSTGYAEVHVVAYMAVTVSNYNTANKPGTLTMTLIPSYYVEVTGAGGNKNVAMPLNRNVSTQLNALRPVNGRALGSLTGEVGTIELTLTKESAFDTTNGVVAHQNNTYAYPSTGSGTLVFEITHAVNSSLGQFIVNGEPGLVELYNAQPTIPGTKPSGPDVEVSYYDTLQAAVDDAENGWYIDVDSNYKGSCNISVTGEARKFQINTNGANRVTSNVTGVVTEKTSGTLYEVQLERSTQPTTNATVTVNTAGNGSATLNVSNAKPGTTVSGTYKANEGYKAGTFTATAKTADGNKSVTVNVKADGTFTFTVPANATSVTVTPNFVADTGLPFTDVAASAWYFDGVKYCYNTTKNGYRVMEGFSSTQFGADRAYTRAEVVTILWNLKGRPTPGAATRTYTDVNSGHWAYNAIVWATNNGYAEGYPNGSFQPSSSVTREEMVVFLWRAAGKPTTYNSINLNGYTDGYNVHDWGLSAMKWAVALNILSGQNSVSLNGTLAARTTAYRREVAVTIMNFDKLNLF